MGGPAALKISISLKIGKISPWRRTCMGQDVASGLGMLRHRSHGDGCRRPMKAASPLRKVCICRMVEIKVAAKISELRHGLAEKRRGLREGYKDRKHLATSGEHNLALLFQAGECP